MPLESKDGEKVPDKDKKSKPITKTKMTQIAEMVTEKTGIPVEVCLP